MFKLPLAIVALLAVASTDAMAHHKPGHNPPGQKLKLDPQALPFSILLLEREPDIQLRVPRPQFGELPPAGGDFEDEWSFYQDPDFGFTIEIPTGVMEQVPEAPRGARFREIGGSGLLDVYGGANSAGLSPEEIAAELEHNPQIGEVIYRASGDNWVVLSGYYTRADYQGDDMIFYAKFMFNEDRSHLSAFEISYPEAERATFDPIIEHMEDTLSPPL